MSKKQGALMSFIGGAFLGFIVGILLAPTKGKNARNIIFYRLKKYASKTHDLLDKLMQTQKENVNKAKEASKEVIENTKNKAKGLIKNIEELTSNIEDFNYNNNN